MKAGVKVYTIGAGTNGVAPICVDRGDGRSQLMQMQRLDRRDDAAQDRRQDRRPVLPRDRQRRASRSIYKQIDKLERTTIEEERFTEYRQYYACFVARRDGARRRSRSLLRGTVLRRLP